MTFDLEPGKRGAVSASIMPMTAEVDSVKAVGDCIGAVVKAVAVVVATGLNCGQSCGLCREQ